MGPGARVVAEHHLAHAAQRAVREPAGLLILCCDATTQKKINVGTADLSLSVFNHLLREKTSQPVKSRIWPGVLTTKKRRGGSGWQYQSQCDEG